MRSGSTRRPEPFWPHQAIKKLFNLNGDEFCTDGDEDVFNEEESSDSYPLDFDKDSNYKAKASPDHNLNATFIQDQKNKHFKRPVEKKSKSFWTHLLDDRDYRIFIGTWNVAGKAPSIDLDLGQWLNTNELADIYVIGFQEIVPLNAGNVLGPEDVGPVSKWENLIWQTLNGALKRSFSAPLPVADSYNNLKSRECCAHDHSASQAEACYKLNECGVTMMQNVTACSNLRKHWKAQSACEPNLRNCSIDSQGPVVIYPEDESSDEASTTSKESKSKNEMHSFGKAASFEAHLSHSNDETLKADSEQGEGHYIRIISKQMVGILITVWVKRNLLCHVHSLKVSCVGCGFMGYYGNKGAVAVSMWLHETSFCFICTHLTSGEKDGDELRRNADVSEILRRTDFSRSTKSDWMEMPRTILGHDLKFMFGDLNYRLVPSNTDTRALLAEKNWKTLLQVDQLKIEQGVGRIFEDWHEGQIQFAPTYKYKVNSDRYFGEDCRPGEKSRTPAWCDRILWNGKSLKQLSYRRAESKFSDHRPVSAVFLAGVKFTSNTTLRRVTNRSRRHSADNFGPWQGHL